jgi:hypothetical protein
MVEFTTWANPSFALSLTDCTASKSYTENQTKMASPECDTKAGPVAFVTPLSENVV